MIDPSTAAAEVDLAAIRANVATIAALVAPAQVMVVVKADGYGHGMIPSARAARAAGATWLGAATPAEALALREAGDTGRILAWLYGPDVDLGPLVSAGIDVSIATLDQLARVSVAGRARVHLKLDTGLSRNGCPAYAWPELCRTAAAYEQHDRIEVIGLWSHLASADEPGAASVAAQRAAFEAGLAVAAAEGLRPQLRHLANSAGALIVPEARYDLVRLGIAAYGIDPAPGVAASAGVQLRPAMRLRAQLVLTKEIEAGTGVSYGHTWHAPSATRVGLVPLGYADGIPRHASNRAEVQVGGRRAPIRGRVCMDQFVVDLGAGAPEQAGQAAILFGDGTHGEPTAADWAAWCDTIGYEIVTRIGARVPRVYLETGASD